MKTKLTKEDILFIDRYLSKSEIKYEDVRIEMIDHIASAIEEKMENGDHRGFYEIFKEYMIENKSVLQKQGNRFSWGILKSVSITFFQSFYTWQVLLGTAFCYPLFLAINFFIYGLNEWYLSFFILMLLGIIFFIPLIKFGKKRFSFINYLIAISGGFFWMNYNFTPTLSNGSIAFQVYLGILALFFVASLKTMLDLISYYEKRFEPS